MNQCIRLMEAFTTFSNIRPIDEVKLAATGFISILGNLRSVKSSSLFNELYYFNDYKLKLKGPKQLFEFKRDIFDK
jgi:hypothetical protein